MSLFAPTPLLNILPYDGEVYYHGCVYASAEGEKIYQNLLHNVAWENDVSIIFGKTFITKRKVAWYGDKPYSYTYSNNTKYALPFSEALQNLKNYAEQLSNATYNSCLLNLYHNGSEGMGWHSDGEKTLAPNGAIASYSFGAERKFAFKHKNTKEVVNINLQHGSLLIMQGSTQTHWLHRLPPTTRLLQPRVNLTFRTIINQ